MTDKDALAKELRAAARHQRPSEDQDLWDRLAACDREVEEALARARAQRFRRLHWWGRDGVDPR